MFCTYISVRYVSRMNFAMKWVQFTNRRSIQNGVPGRTKKRGARSHSYRAERSNIDQRSTHDTHPVFNPVWPTAHSLKASAARGDTMSWGRTSQAHINKIMNCFHLEGHGNAQPPNRLQGTKSHRREPHHLASLARLPRDPSRTTSKPVSGEVGGCSTAAPKGQLSLLAKPAQR